MDNPYYDRLNQYVPGELADGQAVEADFGAVQTGFDRVAKDMQERVTKATLINGKKLEGDISLNAGDVGAMRSLNGQKPDANGDLVMNLLHGSDTADQYVSATYTYDAGGRMSEVNAMYPQGPRHSVFSYGVDGRLLASEITFLGRKTSTQYNYDGSGRLSGSSSVETEL
ncbi:TPA: hypothetical protein P2Q98_001893 [Aeromonas veronii]|uniref:hypothetical protein n=1 Tax=Aeromonas veronii TaxID=654 RepID=UPI00330D3E55|nr:hypothetical protein [Aeromonas veronii]HDO1333733.1 hypothetical protein [Aeromonas veronii]HDO1337427.1 hypothetical protein [Aeromonas veronii]HDO1342809.1 hypothetical protein [Aeromonas veronii]HDO1347148.1 hypothetical protein [Aeromonas veronii]